jgi:hypothetical protein
VTKTTEEVVNGAAETVPSTPVGKTVGDTVGAPVVKTVGDTVDGTTEAVGGLLGGGD